MNKIMKTIKPYLALMRLHRPLPILLILWPTLTALVIASKGIPNLKNLIIFSLGVIIMRTVGCILNDIADRNFDNKVLRTQTRPLTTGEISIRHALILAIIGTLLAFSLVLLLNTKTILLAFIALFLTILYPFCKRFFFLPQLVLGITFNFGILMAFTATTNSIPFIAWLFYIATIIWTTAYDTIYALADRDFDLSIGLNSSAIVFGKKVFTCIAILELIFIILITTIGFILNFNLLYFVCIAFLIILFFKQYRLFKSLEISDCIKAFSNNHWVGFFIFISVLCNFM